MEMTPTQRLELALSVLNLDLEHARPGDVLNAKDDARRFLAPPPWKPGEIVIYRDPGSGEPSWSEISDEELSQMVSDGRALFGSYIEHADTLRRYAGSTLPEKLTSEPFFQFQSVTTKWLLLSFGAPVSQRPLAVLSATSARDAFLSLLGMLALTGAAGDIRACPICGRLFVRSHRQNYCGSRCQGISTSRAYRARKKEERDRKKREGARKRKRVTRKRSAKK